MGARQVARIDKDGRKSKVWIADFWHHFPDGHRERYRLDSPVQTLRGTLSYEQEVRASIAAGTFRRREPRTIKDYSNDFLGWCKLHGRKPSTIDDYERILEKYLKPQLGSVRLSEVSPTIIDQYKAARLAEGLGQKRITNHLIVLKAMLRVACDEHNIISSIPRVRLFKPKHLRDQAFRYLTEEDAEKLLAAADAWRAPIVLALHTGLRRGEFAALRWSDVDLKAGRLLVRRSYYRRQFVSPKSGHGREVPLSDTAIRALKSHPRLLRCELVFHTGAGGPLIESAMGKGLARACKRAGIDRVGWHVLRHTCASWLVQRGVPLRTVQEVLGHSSITVTERYAHLSPTCGREAVRALDGGRTCAGYSS